MTTVPFANPNQSPGQKRRMKLGIAVFAGGWLLGLSLVPVVNSMALPAATTATLNTALILVVPKVFLVMAVAIMGKPGFAYLKSLLGARLKRFAPPAEPGPARYNLGLALLVAAVALGAIGPYVGTPLPGQDEHERLYALAGDLTILLSLSILGGDFWDKLRALFVRRAKAVFPEEAG